MVHPNQIFGGTMTSILFRSLIYVIILLASLAPSAGAAPKYVFYFIGDGMGASQRQFSEFFLREASGDPHATLAMNRLTVAGLTSTHAADTLVTDSAAAATALATGQKTNKGFIAKDPQGKDLTTLIEAAEARGLATGVITTTRITHATPAAFLAHNLSRDNENDIALDIVNGQVEFLAGGGIRNFLPQGTQLDAKDVTGRGLKSRRDDSRDLLAEMKSQGYATFIGAAGAKALPQTDFTKITRALILPTMANLPYDIERQDRFPDCPSLADLVEDGIDVLSQDPDGFFVMVEGGRIDHACHANDPVAAIHGVLALDRAIEQALAFADKHPDDTLIVVVGDHETGGMGLGMDTHGYQLNLQALVSAKASICASFLRGPHKYKGDAAAFFARLEQGYGMDHLTEGERAQLTKSMADADAGLKTGYYGYDPVAVTAARLLSERANIFWTTTIHTATMVPLSAQGPGALAFSGFKDNTRIAITLAEVMGLDL